jgi:putative endonuclease
VNAHGAEGDVYRFDAVGILLQSGGEPQVEHVEDAWRM